MMNYGGSEVDVAWGFGEEDLDRRQKRNVELKKGKERMRME